MALIRRAEAESVASNAVTLHLGDLRRKGDALVAEAKSRAESIVSEARAERERLVTGAQETGYDVGYNKGFAEGLAKGHEDGLAQALESTTAALSSLVESWGLAISRFEDDRERMLAEARSEIVKVAALFAERVTRRVVELDAGVVERQIEAVLRAAIRPSRLTIVVHPDDEPSARRALPGLLKRFVDSEHADLVTDGELDRGSCVARMASGAVIDASIRTQIDRLVSEMLPDGADFSASSGDSS